MWQVLLVDAPDRADIFAVLWIVNFAAARQLRGLLSHFATTLSIALSGQGTTAGAGPSKVTGCQGQVKRCHPVIDALALVFQSTCSVGQGRLSASIHKRRLD